IIITVSSLAALRPNLLGGAAYGAAKAGVRNLMTYLHNIFRNDGIRATTILPGETSTPILDNRAQPPAPELRAAMVQPEDVARAVVLCATLPARTVIESCGSRPPGCATPAATSRPGAGPGPRRPCSPPATAARCDLPHSHLRMSSHFVYSRRDVEMGWTVAHLTNRRDLVVMSSFHASAAVRRVESTSLRVQQPTSTDDLVSLAMGEPNFDTPARIRQAADAALAAGYTHYAPLKGDIQLRE